MNELKRDWRGRVLPKEVSIIPTKDWAYFIGLVLGDGFTAQMKPGGYKVSIDSTRQETVDLFYEAATAVGIHCHKHSWFYSKGGYTRYEASVYSKQLYQFFKRYKLKDYYFQIPPLVLETQDSLRSFLQGFYDAEGTVYLGTQNRASIESYSKHATNLLQIQDCLDILEIKSYLITSKAKSARLAITDYPSRTKFKDLIGFKLEAKKAKLDQMAPPQRLRHSREAFLKSFALRKKGYTYPQIAACLGVNQNTLKGWQSGKIPRQIIMEEHYAKERKTHLCSR